MILKKKSLFTVIKLAGFLIVLCITEVTQAKDCSVNSCPKVEGFITVPERVVDEATIPSAQIFYRQWGICDGSKPTLFFIHGFGFNADIWLCQQAALCNNYCTVAVDWRSVYRSSVTPNIAYTYQLFADDFHSVIQQLGIQNPILVGSSAGGLIAIQYVLLYPGEVSKLVLVDSFPTAVSTATYPLPPIPAAQLPAIVAFITNDFQGFKEFFIGQAFNEACQTQLAPITQYFVNTGFAPQNIILNNYAWLVQDLTAQIPQVNVPTLVLYGGIDASVPINNSFYLRQFIPGATPLVEFPGHGHMPQATDVKRFNCALVKYLQGDLGTSCQICPLLPPAV